MHQLSGSGFGAFIGQTYNWKNCQALPINGDRRGGLAFTGDGQLWILTGTGQLYAADSATGTLGPLVGSPPPPFTNSVYDLKTDPINGDLFMADGGNHIWKVTGWQTKSLVYNLWSTVVGVDPLTGAVFSSQFDGLQFSGKIDCTLYVRLGLNQVISLAYSPLDVNPNQPHMVINNLPSADGIAVAGNNTFILVNDNNGHVYKVTLSDPFPRTGVSIYSNGGTSRGDTATVGPDGCFYITQSHTVVRITTEPDCTCTLAASNPTPCGANCDVVSRPASCETTSAQSNGKCTGISFDGASTNTCN